MSERNSFLESTKESDERLEALRRLYPEIFSDGKINLDAFKDVTGTSDLPEGQDKTPGYYGLYWPGKRAAKQLARKEAEGTLEPVPGDGVNEDSTRNVYIEGDNLEVLRILKQSYKGRVKMIYIDPPYNTGNDFIYPDDYKMPVEEYLRMTGQADEGGKKLVTNVKSGGAFHTNWLNMMYPRLQLARELLTEDGVIFISIDDNEQANLKLLCDDVFGEENFIGNLIIETATDNNPRQISTEHEYMLCYVKDVFVQGAWTRKNSNAAKIIKQYERLKSKQLSVEEIQIELRKWIKENKDELSQVTHYDNVDEKGVFHDGDIANTKMGGYKYEVIHPITKKVCKIPEKGFRFSEETMREMLRNDEILFGEDETILIKPKKRIEDAKELLRSVIYEDGRAATKVVDTLLSRGVFEHPKSPTILFRLIDFVTKHDSIVLDFFSGSATTAHAVMQLNKEDGGRRKFIMVQLPHKCDDNSEAAKAGYKTICEIGKERIRRAGKQILKELHADKSAGQTGGGISQLNFGENDMRPDSRYNPDVGFKVFRLAKSSFRKYTPVQGQDEQAKNALFAGLEGSLVPLVDDWKAENVLTEIILKQGFALDCSRERLGSFSRNTVWRVTDSPDAVSRKITLYVCLDPVVDPDTISRLTLGDDEKFICLDAAIDDSSYARLCDKGRIETI